MGVKISQFSTRVNPFAAGGTERVEVVQDAITRYALPEDFGNVAAIDSFPVVIGSTDPTKGCRIEVDGFSPGQTRVITPPDADTKLPVASQVITWAGPTAARTYTLPDAAATIARTDAAQTFSGTQTFANNVVISGDLTVSGTTTTVNSTDLAIGDNVIVVNKDETGAGVTIGTAGIEVERGSLTNSLLVFRESDDSWSVSYDAGSTLSQLVELNRSQALTGKTVNGLTITTTTGTLTVSNGKTLSASNSLTFAGTDGTTLTFPATSAAIARTDAAQTFAGVQTFSSAPIFSAMSQGSIFFAGASGALSQSTNLFWDNSISALILGDNNNNALRLGQTLETNTSADFGGAAFAAWNASGAGPVIDFCLSRSNSIGTHSIVSVNDQLGAIIWRGSDGVKFLDAAWITSSIDAAPGIDDMGGRLVFHTTLDGGFSPVEAVRINSVQQMVMGGQARALRNGELFEINTSSNYGGMALTTWSATAAQCPTLDFNRSKSNTKGAMTTVAANDAIGRIPFRAADGTNFVTVGMIEAFARGTISAGIVPGDIVFSNTLNGASSPTEMFHLDRGGYVSFAEGRNLAFGTTTGTKIGTGPTQKIAIWGAAPVVQPAAVADASGGAVIDSQARTAINTLLSRMRDTGLIAT